MTILKQYATLAGGLLLLLVLAYAGLTMGWSKLVAGWYRHQDTKHVAQRDQARAERDVARTDAQHEATSADVAQSTRAANDRDVPAIRAVTQAAQERAHEAIPRSADPAVLPERVRLDAADAVARYRAAARRVRGAGAE